MGPASAPIRWVRRGEDDDGRHGRPVYHARRSLSHLHGLWTTLGEEKRGIARLEAWVKVLILSTATISFILISWLLRFWIKSAAVVWFPLVLAMRRRPRAAQSPGRSGVPGPVEMTAAYKLRVGVAAAAVLSGFLLLFGAI